jgi:hypothetical protein
MSSKITFNGVTYDSIDALPPEARRLYDQALANMPDLRNAAAGPPADILDMRDGPIQHRMVVRKKIVVNGVEYDDESAVPPDARQAIEQAQQKLASGDPTIKKNEIFLSFKVTGPGISWRKTFGTPPASSSSAPTPSQSPRSDGSLTPAPIEPPPVEARLRVAIIVATCAAAGLLFWLFSHSR